MLCIKNGFVIDPKNGIAEVMDLFVKDGKIVEDLDESKCKVIDAKGKVVVAGGIDIHAHIAGAKINVGRKMRPEEMRYPRFKANGLRSGVGRVLLTSPAIGYEYARMGYTTAVEPAMPTLYATHTHEELDSIPIVDKMSLPLFGNWHFVFKFVKNNEIDKLANFIAWVLAKSKGYGVKVVNPCGVEAWMFHGNVHSLDEAEPLFGVTPKEVITGLISAIESLGLPHSLHIHCNELGVPGNYEVTIETIKLAEKFENPNRQVMHITHVQFNSYAGESWKDMRSGAEKVAKAVNKHNVTIDMGQVILGHATTMTADSPFQFELFKLFKTKWSNNDIELETGSGIVPVVYKPKIRVHALMWAIGLEIGLLVDVDKVVISTDYPNGGPFYSYPYIATLLMSEKFRQDEMAKMSNLEKASILPSLDVERTLEDIIKITRVNPAKILGLSNKGHLGVGAEADIVIYDLPAEPNPRDYESILRALSNPSYVIKNGEVVVKDGRVVKHVWGKTFWVKANYSEELIEPELDEFFSYYTVQRENYGVSHIRKEEVVNC
ncbi:formylmethanofuran dehydrogenase subunit A [Archaeoglobus sp.]